MDKHALIASEIPIGSPVEWDVFDRDGNVLLRKGMTVRSPLQVAKLVEHGAFHFISPAKNDSGSTETGAEQSPPTDTTRDVLSPFDNILNMAKESASLFKQITRVVPDESLQVPEKLLHLCQKIETLCDYDLDATLGALHLWHEVPYVISHPVNTAILSRLIAMHLGWEAERTQVLMAAALTSNIGMYELQHSLAGYEGELTAEQKDAINKHPLRSAVLLKRWGVKNRSWLDAVIQHHERIDGKGYPQRLDGDNFIVEARIIGLADRYHALLSPRKNRKGLSPTEAINKVFRQRGKEVDAKLAHIFINELGIYPPGSTVKLKNGETAIVTRRGKDKHRPEVKSILNERNMLYPVAKERDPTRLFFEIVGITDASGKYKPDLKELWGYKLT